jgi:class 3 adenylate cyclase
MPQSVEGGQPPDAIAILDALRRLPEHNPNPVMQVRPSGELVYANPASRLILEGLELGVGGHLPQDLMTDIQGTLPADAPSARLRTPSRVHELRAVNVPELGILNVYFTDVTAMELLTRFPGQNPNPVIRIGADGRLLYGNAPAASLVDVLFPDRAGPAAEPVRSTATGTLTSGESVRAEVEAAGRLYMLVMAPVREFDFVNIYGTDITDSRDLEIAHQENEALLLNILPEPIARRLQGGEKVIADHHDDVAILFADLVGFTNLSNTLSPRELVDLLGVLFSRLDELADRHRVEKIKTIGDAYMAASGLLGDSMGHVDRIIDLAFDMLEVVRTFQGSQAMQMRIGIHSGPVVAGVIGTRKFIFDVWGDTVNTASRMESHGEPGRIHVSDAVRRAATDRRTFIPRGEVLLKGKGVLTTWFVDTG